MSFFNNMFFIKKCDVYSDNSHHVQITQNSDSNWLIAKLSWNFYSKKCNAKIYSHNNADFQKQCFEYKIKHEDIINEILVCLLIPIRPEYKDMIKKKFEMINHDFCCVEYSFEFDITQIDEAIVKNKCNPIKISKILDEKFNINVNNN